MTLDLSKILILNKFKDCFEILIKTLQDGNVESPEQVLSVNGSVLKTLRIHNKYKTWFINWLNNTIEVDFFCFFLLKIESTPSIMTKYNKKLEKITKLDQTVIIQASFYKLNCFKPIKFSQHQGRKHSDLLWKAVWCLNKIIKNVIADKYVVLRKICTSRNTKVEAFFLLVKHLTKMMTFTVHIISVVDNINTVNILRLGHTVGHT